MPPPFLSSNPSSLSTGPGALVLNTVHPLTPVSNHLGLDGLQATPSEVGQWSGGARKRKRETSLSQVQQSPFDSPAARSKPTLHEQYYDGRPWKSRRNNPISPSDGGGYMSDSPPAAYRLQSVQQRREKIHSGSFLDRSGYETDEPSPSLVRARPGPSSGCSSDRKMSSLLKLPPAPMEAGSRYMQDKVTLFLQNKFMEEDTLEWNEFSRDRAHVGSLSSVMLLRAYWFAQGQLETWVGSRLPKHLKNKKVEIVSCQCLFFFMDCYNVRFLVLSGSRPRCAWSYGGLVSGMQRDALARDCVWRAGGEMGELSGCRCVS